MKILQCKLTTIEAMLGTASNNKELHSEFIASHAPDAPSREEEIAAVGGAGREKQPCEQRGDCGRGYT